MHMEKFKNVLIPVELVWYAYFDEDENETNVILSAPNATQGFSSRTVSFTGNHLNSFNKWYTKVTSKTHHPVTTSICCRKPTYPRCLWTGTVAKRKVVPRRFVKQRLGGVRANGNV